MRPVGLGERIPQALTHGWVHAQLGRLLRVEPGGSTGLVMIGPGVVRGSKGVKAHRKLLIDALLVGIGQDMAWVAVHPGKPGDGNHDAGLFGHFPSHRGGGRFPDFDPAPGQLPVPIVDTAHKQDLIAMISHERKRGREKFAGFRRCDVVVVLRPRHAPDHQQPETPQQQTHD